MRTVKISSITITILCSVFFVFSGCGASTDEDSHFPFITGGESGNNISIDGKTFPKTSFSTVIEKGSSVTIPSECDKTS